MGRSRNVQKLKFIILRWAAYSWLDQVRFAIFATLHGCSYYGKNFFVLLVFPPPALHGRTPYFIANDFRLNYYALIMALTTGFASWKMRMLESGFFLGALLFHLIIFLMVATWVVFKAPDPPDQSASFLQVAIPRPVPPAPAAPSGGASLNNYEPTVQNTPPPAMPTLVTTSSPSTFNVSAVHVTIPDLPASITKPSGSGMQGHEAPGQDLGAGNPFGSIDSKGTPQLQGSLYDLKQTGSRAPTNMDPGKYHIILSQFVAANWDPGILRDYYKCSKVLNTASIFIPTIKSEDGPKAFGVENEVQPNMYFVWYKVTAAPPQDGTYHFAGAADDIMLVRVNGKTVLDASDRPVDQGLRDQQKTYDTTNFTPTWEGDSKIWVGLPFHAASGEPVDIDVVIGEEPGGKSNYFLYIQREESTYKNQSNGAPLLPVFQLDPQPIQPAGEPCSYPPFAETPEPWTAVGK